MLMGFFQKDIENNPESELYASLKLVAILIPKSTVKTKVPILENHGSNVYRRQLSQTPRFDMNISNLLHTECNF